MSTTVIFPSNSRNLGYLLKATVLGVFIFLLYRSFHQQENLTLLFNTFTQKLQSDRISHLVIALLMVYLNWRLEAIKWQKLLQPVQSLTMKEAFRAVLIGLTTSIFTPNRIGEYVGRVITIDRKKKLGAVSALSLGSFTQLLMLSCLGILALGYLALHSYRLPYAPSISWFMAILLVTFVFIGLLNISSIYRVLKIHFGSYWPKIWSQLDFLAKLPKGYFVAISWITFFRIVIYVLQYWLLIRFFQIEVRADLAIATILVGYFIQSGLPLPTLLALVARGEITLLLWNFFAVNELSILAASYGLWVINVVLPALVGMIYVMKIRIKST